MPLEEGTLKAIFIILVSLIGWNLHAAESLMGAKASSVLLSGILFIETDPSVKNPPPPPDIRNYWIRCATDTKVVHASESGTDEVGEFFMELTIPADQTPVNCAVYTGTTEKPVVVAPVGFMDLSNKKPVSWNFPVDRKTVSVDFRLVTINLTTRTATAYIQDLVYR